MFKSDPSISAQAGISFGAAMMATIAGTINEWAIAVVGVLTALTVGLTLYRNLRKKQNENDDLRERIARLEAILMVKPPTDTSE